MASVKNIMLYSKLVLLFLKFLNMLVCVPSFKSIAVFYLKRSIVRVISNPPHVSNYKIKLRLWENRVNYLLSHMMQWITRHFLNIAFCKLFYTYFSKTIGSKNWAVFYIPGLGLGWHSVLQYWKLCFWCSLCKVTGN